MNYWARIKIILLNPRINIALLIALLFVFGYIYWNFNQSFYRQWLKQEKSFIYYIKPGRSAYQVVIGDLLGVNALAQERALGLVKSNNDTQDSLIVIPTLTKYFKGNGSNSKTIQRFLNYDSP